jgi:CDP-diacylglycerol--serine O-phosphatidyltransferase
LGKKGVYLIPNLFTTANLFCGVFAILAVFDKAYVNAAMAILIATIFDSLDGKLARMTKTTSRFGLEYDSLSDVISFGVAPGFLVYAWGLGEYGRLGWAAVFLYIACGALRLSRFNVKAATMDTKGFMGLPIPAAAALIASLVILDDYILHVGKEVRPVVVLSMTYVLAFLMVSSLPYRGLKDIHFRDQTSFSVLVATVLILLVLVVATQVMIFSLALLYVISGIIEKPVVALYRLLAKGTRDIPLEEEKR